MSSKLVPSDPSKVMVIRDLVPNTVTTFSTPFWRFGRIKIGGRGTVVRLQNGSLAVFSPTALTPEVKSKIASMGEVKYITAPDAEHHIFLGPWHQEYPSAILMGPEPLPENRRKQNYEEVPFAHVFSKDKPVTKIDEDFDREFDYEYVYAHQNKEIVFNHKPTKTLIQADLLFNYPANEQFSRTGVSPTSGIFTKLFGAFTNTNGNMQRRMVWYGTGASDRIGFSMSMAKINDWSFDTVIPCHGDVIEGKGKEVFRHVFAWNLDLAKKQT